MRRGRRRAGSRAFWAALILTALSVAAEERAPQGTVRIGGEVRFKKAAPVFLQLIALDETKKEVAVRERIIELTAEDVARGTLRFEFSGLLPGRYALKSFQDTNGNKRIDIGLFGPKEPWATYRVARPKLRAPRFEEMAFDASTDVTDADLVMR